MGQHAFQAGQEVVELLRTPSDLESGKGSSDELAKKAGLRKPSLQGKGELPMASSITTHTHGGRRMPEPWPEAGIGRDVQILGWLLSLRQLPHL